MFDPLTHRVAARFLIAEGYFKTGDRVLYGKYKNKVGIVKAFGSDKWGNPTIEIEPVPKGRKQNKVFGLYKVWRADVKEKALAEQAAQAVAGGTPTAGQPPEDDQDDEDDEDDEDGTGKEAGAAPKGPLEADAPLHEPLSLKALEHLIAAGRGFGITIKPEGSHKLLVQGPDGMKEKELSQAFDKAWGRAGMLVQTDDQEAWGAYSHSHPGANWEEWYNHQPKSGLGLLHRPKLDFGRYTKRQVGTGRYMHTKWTRLCRTCGHPVGFHSAEKAADGAQPCFMGDFTGIACPCEKFVPSNKFMSDEDYARIKQSSLVDRLVARFEASTQQYDDHDFDE